MKRLLALLLLCLFTHASENNPFSKKKNQDSISNLDDVSKAESHINLTDYEIIEKLDVRNKNLSHLSPVISRFVNLRVLYADNNTIKKLPSEISCLAQLVGLRLDNNQLSELPNLQSLCNLEFASLSGNKLTTLETSDGNLVFPEQLRILNLERNKLGSLPTTINTLTQLFNLNVSHNTIDMLPDELGKCYTLHVLNISHNKLSQLPTTITQLTNLNSLKFNNNLGNFLQNSAQNIQVAAWISTPLIKEMFLKAQNIKNEREYCSQLEQLPSELVEKIIISLSKGTHIIQNIQTVLNVSRTNKAIKNKVKQSLAALNKKLAKHYSICPVLVTWHLGNFSYSAIEKALKKLPLNETYHILQDAQRMYALAKNNERSETINAYIMNVIKESNSLLQREVNKKIGAMTNVIWVYNDGSALLVRQSALGNDLVFYHVINENRLVSDNCLFNTIFESGNVTSHRETHAGLSHHKNNECNKFALMHLTPLRFPETKNYSPEKCNAKIPSTISYATVQQDNKIIVACVPMWSNKYILIRANPSGTLDMAFGKNGIVQTDIEYCDEKNQDNCESDTQTFGNNYLADMYEYKMKVNKSFVTIDHQTKNIIFKCGDTVKKYKSNGQSISE